MKKCILFGCGQIGTVAYWKLLEIYEIVAFADNNEKLWGTTFMGIKIISPIELVRQKKMSNIDVVIAINDYKQVFTQLRSLNIDQIMIWRGGLLYHSQDGNIYPAAIRELPAYKKGNSEEFHVLFVQMTACVRTHKIARALSVRGVKVSLIYLEQSPKQNNLEYADIYEQIYPIDTFYSLIDLVNKSDFDVIHSSNEPDILTALLISSNKPVIHDCHDLSSAYKSMTPEEITIEFLANKKSKGIIYTTDGIRNEALRKFEISKNKTFVLENMISEELVPSSRYKKLSKSDGELHCVYEGGVIVGDTESHRYFEKIWKQIATCGVHVHFYSNCKEADWRKFEALDSYIHYEGNLTSHQLAMEMSKYDVGLCILNITDKNRQYAEYASPNKIQEYINAGIPVAVGAIMSNQEFVEKNGFGKKIEMSGDILKQLQDISQIEIKDNVLHDRGFTLESRIPELIKFYKKCMEDRK